jgi:hypothetical protein
MPSEAFESPNPSLRQTADLCFRRWGGGGTLCPSGHHQRIPRLGYTASFQILSASKFTSHSTTNNTQPEILRASSNKQPSVLALVSYRVGVFKNRRLVARRGRGGGGAGNEARTREVQRTHGYVQITNKPTNQPINHMKQSPFWESNRLLVSQIIPKFSWNPKVPSSHEPPTCPCYYPDKSTSLPVTLFVLDPFQYYSPIYAWIF